MGTALVAAASGLAQYRLLVQELKSKETRLRAISDTSLDAIIVFDAQGTIHEFNRGPSAFTAGRPRKCWAKACCC